MRKQSHNREGSLAFRFHFPDGGDFCYVTDGEPTNNSIEFVAGTKLLLHEHYLPGEELFLGWHTTTVGAASVAKEGSVGKLVLVHHYPFADNNQLARQLILAQKIYSKTVLAEDRSYVS